MNIDKPTIEQWREMLQEYPHMTQEQIIKSTYWMMIRVVEDETKASSKNA